MFPHIANTLDAVEEEEEAIKQEEDRGGGGKIILDNVDENNYDEDGGSDILAGLGETWYCDSLSFNDFS